ncbi:U-box domain-containing protein 33 [Triticum urartu]|uniref:RING-type E3 ubiquitin transferase n=1 Tax=Triticum urartu TaxID=4572 RepID=M8ARS4_TRIUA|nr:U-box domain-containing protein 33 [Triticum urartu]
MEAHRRWDTSGSGSRYSFRTSNLAKDGAQVVVAHVHRPAQMIPMMGAKMHYTRLDPEQVKDYRKQELEKALERLEEYVVICTILKVNCEKIIIEKDDVAKGLEELIVLHGITRLVMGAAADKHYSKKMKRPKSKTALRLMEAEASPCKIWFTCKGELICTREANTTIPMIPPSPASTVASTLSASSISSRMRSITIHHSESEAPSSNGSPQQNLNRSRTEVMRHHSRGAGGTPPQLFEPLELNANARPTRTPLSSMDSWDEFGRRSQSSWYNLSRNYDAISVSESATHHPMHESDDDRFSSPFHELENPGADAEMYSRLEEALRETQESKKEVFEESTKRRKAELDLLSALQKAKELEKLYHHELRQRKTIEETLVRQAQELEATKIQCDTIYDQLHDAEEQKAVLEQRMTEMESALRDGEEKLATSKCLLEALQADKENLQQERDAAAEELRQKSEQRISMATEALNTEFSAVELEQATRSFDEALKIGEGGFGCVYKGSLRSTTVAIKLLHPKSLQGQSEFNQEPANILLDANLVSKLGDFGICRLLTQSGTSTAATTLYRTTTPRGTFAYMDPEFLSSGELTPRSDVYSLGIIILQLLTGRRPQKIAEVVEDAVEKGELHTVLDTSAGAWPFVQANQLAHLGLRCAEMSRRRRPDLAREVWTVVEPLMKAASLTARRPTFAPSPDEASTPSYFVCPIFQEMMSDPHIAADGFTYEAEAIRGWLDSGHDTSPMTNLKLAHRELTPNRGLRSVILEWQLQHQRYHEDWR